MNTKRIISLLLVFALTFCTCTVGVNIFGEETNTLTNRLMTSFEQLPATQEYSDSSEKMNVSYLGSGSKIMIVSYPDRLVGNKSAKVVNCDMRWWSLSINEKEYYIDLSFKIDESFNQRLIYNLTTQQPSTTGGSSSDGNFITLTRRDDDGVAVLTDYEGNTLLEPEYNTVYNIRCSFRKGRDTYSVSINENEVSSDSRFEIPVYTIEALALQIFPLDNTSSETDEPYMIIDNIAVYTSSRENPQKYSLQEPGDMPSVTLPEEAVKSNEITVYVNTTEIAMVNPPILKNGQPYLDMEHLAACLGLIFTEKSGKFEMKGTELTVTGAVGSGSITVNGKQIGLSYAPCKHKGKIWVAPDFINETLNAKVWWDEADKILAISTGVYKNDGVLRIVGGKLYMNGEPYYEISFNKFDLFYQIMSDYVPNNAYPTEDYTYSAAEEALKQLNSLGFKSIRSFVYSSAFNDLMYNEEHMTVYLEAMDKFFDLCDKYDIKVVVCMGLIESHLLSSEYVDGKGYIVGDDILSDIVAKPDSEARSNVYKYIDTIVNRYKDRDSVLMWEIRNEANLEADIGEAVADVRFSLLQLAEFYGACADRIRAIDSKHLISGGDSALRNAQWHLLQSTMSGSPIDWTTDTKEEHMKATALLVEKLDVISIHPYGLGGTDEFAYRGEDGEPVRCSFDFYMEVANRLGKVLYNGETNSRASIDDPDFNSQSEAYLNDIINARVQLTHWWNFRSDRQGFNDGYLWRIDSGDLLDIIVNANKKIKEKYVVNGADSCNTGKAWEDETQEVFDYTKISDGKAAVNAARKHTLAIILASVGGVLLLAGAAAGILVARRKKRKLAEDPSEN